MPSTISPAKGFILVALLAASTALASEPAGAATDSELDVPDASRIELQKMLELHRTIPVELRNPEQTAVNRKPAIDGPPVYSAASSSSENDSAASVDSISESPVEAAKPN